MRPENIFTLSNDICTNGLWDSKLMHLHYYYRH